MTIDRPRQLKLAVVNLPHRVPLSRRYSCTYYTPLFLFPPHELLQLAACARQWNQAEVAFLDAIAERCNASGVHAFLDREKPDVMVSVIGIESVSDDLACLDAIKAAFPGIAVCVFGWYPSCLPEEVLAKSKVDFILRGEPEAPFSDYLKARASDGTVENIPGLAGRTRQGEVFANPVVRMSNLDELPFPDYRMVDVRKYEELLLGGPCGAILSSRGCPYRCTFCTTTYGRQLIQKSPEVVVAEIRNLMNAGVRLVRFMDDTFTANRSRVLRICQSMVEQGIRVRWACLTRIDCIDEEMLAWMKRAGCVRILIGLESYSKKVLDYFGKNVDPAIYNPQLALIRKAGIQSIGFILVGAPVETEEDFQATLQGVLASPLDLVGAGILTAYAGTPLFENARNDIVFSLVPYEFRFRDESVSLNAIRREKTLYLRFYVRPSILFRQIRLFLSYPMDSLRLALMIVRYQLERFTSHRRPDMM